MAWYRSEVGIQPGSLFLIGVVFLLTYIVVCYFKRKHKFMLIEQLPGPDPFSLYDHIKHNTINLSQLFHFINGISYICGLSSSLYRVRVDSRCFVILIKARAVEVILNSNKHLDKAGPYSFLHPWLGMGLLTSSGEKWHTRRKILTPAFHFKILEDFMDVYTNQSDILVRKLLVHSDGNAFNIYPFITLCTLDIICETAMGTSVHAQDDSESDYVKAVGELTDSIRQRIAKPWQHPKLLFHLLGHAQKQNKCLEVVHGFSKKTIHERRIIYEAKKKAGYSNQDIKEEEMIIGKKTRKAFLDLLLEQSEGERLSDQDIQEEVDTFMFEGHDTTATGINWFIYLLGCNPHIQEKLHEELDQIFGDSDRPVTMADLRELNYMERCIKETLRLYPSVPAIGRQIKEDVVIDNYRIPSGTLISIDNYRLHRDPGQFPNPQVFDPDRFLPENCKRRHPYAYVPFSAGPRNCIGQKFALMEEKVILSNIFRKFIVESTIRREDLEVVSDLIIRPMNGNIVKLFPRMKK